jgi:hypothetical protein
MVKHVHKWFCVALLVSQFSSQLCSATSDADVLNRPVHLTEFKGTAAGAIASLLGQAGVPGEIVSTYDSCAQPGERVFSVDEGAKLKQALDYVVRLDGTSEWRYSGGVLIFSAGRGEADLLKTIVHNFVINPKDALSLSTQQLVQSSEVENWIKKQNFTELPISLGYGSVSRDPEFASRSSSDAQPIVVRDKTVEQVLNILAASKGQAVWHFEQFTCHQKSSFRISWAIS